ncbi:hypothetical protein TNCV_2816281 [Trichonephila clavipes]|nr:hypothetical protein TNCV_2816281 [Trichonephila clavipes]
MEGDSGRGELVISAVSGKLKSKIRASRRETRLLLVVRDRNCEVIFVCGRNGSVVRIDISHDAWWWAEHMAVVRIEILSSSTFGLRMPEKSDNRTEFFKLLRKSDKQVVTARALS